MDHVTLCSKLKAALMEQRQWPDICRLQGEKPPTSKLALISSSEEDEQSILNLPPPPPPQKTLAVCSISAGCGSVAVSGASVSDRPSS
ncbi:hypothetical protein F2P81_026426 [Scophthalmus maximus]|uniref:Uncharacterized protein n=1 Tax=Scophthalmus maximus TaxID=52904 RepID=A0A6A4RPN9_SCOMX|nr:hypothetical protein F2P81_026426 [Scophthalmus maximus]